MVLREAFVLVKVVPWYQLITFSIALREDKSRISIGYADHHLAVICHLALNLLRQEKTAKIGIKTKRLKAGWSQEYLLKVLSAVN